MKLRPQQPIKHKIDHSDANEPNNTKNYHLDAGHVMQLRVQSPQTVDILWFLSQFIQLLLQPIQLPLDIVSIACVWECV